MVKFLLVYLVPLIPLLVVGVVLKDKQISENKIVAYGAKLGGPSATYVAFALLALRMWPATRETMNFTVQLIGSQEQIQQIGIRGTIAKLWSEHDSPVAAKIVPTTPRSLDLDFDVPSHWDGHTVRLEILSSFPWQHTFNLSGHSTELNIETNGRDSDPIHAPPASPSNGTMPLYYSCHDDSECMPNSMCIDNNGDQKFYCKPTCTSDADCHGNKFGAVICGKLARNTNKSANGRRFCLGFGDSNGDWSDAK